MFRLRWAALGALVFAACHGVEVVYWRDWFAPAGDFPPWFLNANRAVLFTAAASFSLGVLSGIVRHASFDDALRRVAYACVGELAAFGGGLIATGVGTIFPIVLAVGALVLVSCALFGSAFGWGLAELVVLRARLKSGWR